MRPRYDYGDEVRVLRNLRNDGTVPGIDVGRLLVRRGSTGFVRDLGTFLQDQIIYAVDFLAEGRLVGCREEELQPASAPWNPSRFESRERVVARLRLGSGGRVLVERGEVGEVLRVLRDAPGGVSYHVLFDGRSTLQVPESALDPVGGLEGPAAGSLSA
jgi:nitrogen fixation protein NifZ